MQTVRMRGLDGDREISRSNVDSLRSEISGSVLERGAPGYDDARAIWNGMVDRRPGLIVRCTSAGDVAAAVRFAREHQLLVAVRGGGHNIAGNAVCDDGLQINLSALNNVTVDPDARTVRVEPGATLADVDREPQKFGLAVPVGINSTTGIAGLTLGGGFGWTSRKYGLAIDNLVAAAIVTADGQLRQVDAQTEPDLFWAIRGGGGNFGVVTAFEFRLNPVGPEVLSGLIVHPFEDARPLLQFYRDFCASAPDELTVWVVMRQAPPLPFLPPEVHGKEVVVLAVCYIGQDLAAGERALAPLRAFGNKIAEHIGPTPFADWQTAFDPLLTPGARNYWKSVDFEELNDGAINAMIDGVSQLPDGQCEVFIAQVGGAISRVAPNATAYTFRSAPFAMNVHGRWNEPAKDKECVSWARSVFENVKPHAVEGVYVNFMSEDDGDRVRPAYGSNYDRLVEIKNRYDPNNLFRLNQNIRPSVAAAERV